MWFKRREPTFKPIPLPKGLKPDLVPIGNEINRLHESYMWNAQMQFEAVRFWKSVYIILGSTSAGIATFAGGKGLAGNNPKLAGIGALISAAMGFTLTALNPTRRVTQAQAVAAQYQEGQIKARQAITIHLSRLSVQEAQDLLENLTEKNLELHKVADPPNAYLYWKAKRSIEKKGRQNYAVDKGGENG